VFFYQSLSNDVPYRRAAACAGASRQQPIRGRSAAVCARHSTRARDTPLVNATKSGGLLAMITGPLDMPATARVFRCLWAAPALAKSGQYHIVDR
jgi:hypothetical protein